MPFKGFIISQDHVSVVEQFAVFVQLLRYPDQLYTPRVTGALTTFGEKKPRSLNCSLSLLQQRTNDKRTKRVFLVR